METIVLICESEKLGSVFFVPTSGAPKTHLIYCVSKEIYWKEYEKYVGGI